jgi:hypothetical protein
MRHSIAGEDRLRTTPAQGAAARRAGATPRLTVFPRAIEAPPGPTSSTPTSTPKPCSSAQATLTAPPTVHRDGRPNRSPAFRELGQPQRAKLGSGPEFRFQRRLVTYRHGLGLGSDLAGEAIGVRPAVCRSNPRGGCRVLTVGCCFARSCTSSGRTRPRCWSGRPPLVSSSGARPLHRRGRARVGATRSRCRGAAALLPEAKHRPPSSDQVLDHLARMTGSKRRRTHIARRGGAWEQ